MTRRSRRKSGKKKWKVKLLLFALLAVGATFAWRAWQRESRLAGLRETRRVLREELAALRGRDPLVATAPEGEVLLGVPENAGATLLRHLTAGPLHRVEVELRNLAVRKSGSVRVKLLFGRMTAGTYALDLRIHKVKGVLEAGAPRLDYVGGRVGVEVPVRVAQGEGRGTLRFRWNSKGVANAVCGDFAVRIPVAGTVVPHTYPVKGSFGLDLSEGTLVASPSFPDLKVNLKIDPAQETWEAFERVLGERGFQCRAALKKADVPDLVRRLFDKGFDVKVPQKIFRPLRLPAGLETDLALAGATYAVRITPRELKVAPHVVWYAADLAATRRSPPASDVSPAPPR
jgi:hypothetical protein